MTIKAIVILQVPNAIIIKVYKLYTVSYPLNWSFINLKQINKSEIKDELRQHDRKNVYP